MLSQPYTRREYFIHSPGVYGAPYTPVSSLSAHTLLAVPSISRASVVQVKPPYVGRHYGLLGDDDDGFPPYIEVLRGRDERDGRDGGPGPRGPAGRDGVNREKGM